MVWFVGEQYCPQETSSKPCNDTFYDNDDNNINPCTFFSSFLLTLLQRDKHVLTNTSFSSMFSRLF